MEEQQKEAKSHISIDNNITPQIPTINFSNVAGVDDVKDELEEIIDFLKNPKNIEILISDSQRVFYLLGHLVWVRHLSQSCSGRG